MKKIKRKYPTSPASDQSPYQRDMPATAFDLKEPSALTDTGNDEQEPPLCSGKRSQGWRSAESSLEGSLRGEQYKGVRMACVILAGRPLEP